MNNIFCSFIILIFDVLYCAYVKYLHIWSSIFSEAVSEDDKPVQQGILSTPLIIFERKKSCDEIYCPANSKCLDLYPAACRCNYGYVQRRTDGTCVKEGVFRVRNIHVRTEVLADVYLKKSESAEWQR